MTQSERFVQLVSVIHCTKRTGIDSETGGCPIICYKKLGHICSPWTWNPWWTLDHCWSQSVQGLTRYAGQILWFKCGFHLVLTWDPPDGKMYPYLFKSQKFFTTFSTLLSINHRTDTGFSTFGGKLELMKTGKKLRLWQIFLQLTLICPWQHLAICLHRVV